MSSQPQRSKPAGSSTPALISGIWGKIRSYWLFQDWDAYRAVVVSSTVAVYVLLYKMLCWCLLGKAVWWSLMAWLVICILV